MASITVTLRHGLKLDEKPQLAAVLRSVTAGDIIEAGEESEKLVIAADGPALVQSPTLTGAHLLRRQVVSIGEIQGPLTLGQLKKFDPEDFQALQAAAATLDAASVKAASTEVAQRGRDGERPRRP